jgi:UDP-2,4-diacetamido-2,4,6-trideoxy-beta-L-altropyranose hydrolase
LNILIRADANRDIGSGHLMRCIALGQMLQDKGHSVYFISKTLNKYFLGRLKKEVFNYFIIDDKLSLSDDAKKTIEAGKNISADWIITDGYVFTTDYQQEIKNSGFKLMCIDDMAKYHFVSDIILNQNLNAENIFKYSCEDYTKLLLGVENVLLRREYRNLKDYKREINSECKNILISLGGSDPENHTAKILKSLNHFYSYPLNIRILLGPDYAFKNALNELVKNSVHKIELLESQENLIPFIQWCDAAISSSGSIVWEFAVLGTPLIVIPIADNQEPIAEELSRRKSAVALKKEDEISNYTEIIESVFLNSESREQLSQCISKLIKPETNKITDYIC